MFDRALPSLRGGGDGSPFPFPSLPFPSLPSPASLEVEVLSPLGNPIPDGEVSCYALSAPDTTSRSQRWKKILIEPAGDGIFRKTLAPGPYRLEVSADGRQSEVIKNLDLPAGDSKPLKITLPPGYVIAG